MTASTHDPLAWAWLGTIFLLFGEIAALISLPNLTRVVIVSTVAELGYVLMGLGLGGAVGDTGAVMHIGYQLLMRGLVVVAGWYLIRRTASSNLNDLAGSGYRMPFAATLFGFGMFSVMGLSPFKGSFSKFLILYEAIEQGQWVMAAVGTVASIVAAAYYILVIQKVCFEHPGKRIELHAAPSFAIPAAVALAVATIVVSLWPHPFQHLAEEIVGVAGSATVPEFESPWEWLVMVPYVGGFLIYGIGRYSAAWRDRAAVCLAVATVAMTAFYDGLDPASRLFALLFAGIACVMVVYSVGAMARAEWANRYYFFVFLMIGSMLGLTTAHELGNFYVFWELMTWTSYFLVIHNQSQKALKAGFLYFIMCAGGAYVMHYGILLVHVELGTFEFGEIAQRVSSLSPLAGLVTAACFFVGFAVKAGLFPLHSWLPAAYPQAPSAASGPLSGILSKAGVFGMVKVLYVVFGVGALSSFSIQGFDITHLMLVLGCVTILYGEGQALFQTELKRMLAYSSLAQLGEIIAILGIGTALATDAALLHVTNHAIMKTLLFYAAGAFILRTGLRHIDDFAGLGRVMPVSAGAYALASFAIMGLPPFSGFTSKFLMIYAAAHAGHVLVAAIMLLGGIIGVVYYTRVVAVLFYHPYKGDAAVREAPATMLTAICVLAGAIVLGGIAPGYQLDLVARVGDLVASRGGLAMAELPNLVTHWPLPASIAMVGAIAVLLTGTRSVKWAGRLAVSVLLAALVAVLFDAGRMDLLSFCFAILIAGVGALNMMHTTAYLAHSHSQARFFAAFTVMIAGLLGMTAAKDIFTFFAFWELMSSWALWAAIVHEETVAARREGFKYFLFNSIGAAFLFLGVALAAAQAGTFQLTDMGAALAALPAIKVAPAVALIFLGFVMKAAMLPVRIDYQMHPALAPTPVSGYISAVLLKAGPWGVLKFFVLFGGAAFFSKFGGTFDGQPLFMEAISVIAGVTIVYAGAMAVLQNGIKLLLIYSTVCQLGYVLMALSFGTSLGVAGGLMYFVNHMLLKDSLFLVAGAIMVQGHATMLDELGGLGRRMPITFGVFLFAGLSLAGIPPLNGFASKWMVFEAAFQSGHWLLGSMAMISSLFTLAAVLKFAHAAFLGAPSEKSLQASEAPLAMLVPMLVLTGASVAVGVMPGLLLVPIAAIQADLGMVPIEATLAGPLPGAGGWSPGLMSVLMLVLTLLTMPWLRLGRGAGVVKTPVHECGAEELSAATTRVGAGNLYEAPSALIRRTLIPSGLIPAKKLKGR
ncbi:proton-conducting transporter membrane subunit [Consotaella salsifontis]|uniref:Formate hydrogenlyase subunit 3/Multisubunit Na+/H+ antiporter, MnhD subunit n=1 Tax=Consotaella salsifontis TaxID=1365950 RepID=A0A1T4LFE1_9HYPH|nr:proton-conducting transporter membrane subunit [Consotaella salsifontis]SJZ53435.1 Formate hydrogenlyase subunit 3/Multisubunit Na+/H+ antiporter, MnhD subunit [Consotaella salsifontis]